MAGPPQTLVIGLANDGVAGPGVLRLTLKDDKGVRLPSNRD
jgi:hypothetical protein